MSDILSWIFSDNLDAATSGGVVLVVAVIFAIMVPCTVVVGALRRARRQQAERMRAEQDRVMFGFRHI